MPKTYTYLLVDIGCILIPFLFSFHPKLKFVNQWKNFVLPCLLTAIFFLIWDAYFTRLGIWSFNPDYVVGIYFFGLPIEEVMFFICIPYACVFTYHCISLYLDFSFESKFVPPLLYVMIAGLFTIALFNLSRLYTSVTFVLLSIFIIILLWNKVKFLSLFLLSFILILPFFFLSNGILTGSFIDAPVVLYNNAHNLSIRLFTIPVEDVFYGMLLLLMNVTGYEYLRSREEVKSLKYKRMN